MCIYELLFFGNKNFVKSLTNVTDLIWAMLTSYVIQISVIMIKISFKICMKFSDIMPKMSLFDMIMAQMIH